MLTLTKNRIKYIQSLQKKRHRDEAQCFLAEGNRLVADLLPHLRCQILVTTPERYALLPQVSCEELYLVDQSQLDIVTTQKSAQETIAVFHKRQPILDLTQLDGKLSLALDTVQDPGNLGTIIRIADWFGIENILCSRESADLYNPKTVQSTMGAIARVNLFYVDLPETLAQTNLPLYGTFLDGGNLYNEALTPHGIIIMGNEGNGISPEIERIVTHKLLIPGFPLEHPPCESLNVAVATSLVCAEFRRRIAR